MAKPVRYPKKLRVKLEKVAAGARERVEETAHEAGFNHFSNTFWMSFAPVGSVSLLRTELDETLSRLSTVMHMEAPLRAEWVTTPAPWEKTGASS